MATGTFVDNLKPNFHINQYMYKSRDLMWESMRFCYVAHSLKRKLKYSLATRYAQIYIYIYILSICFFGSTFQDKPLTLLLLYI